MKAQKQIKAATKNSNNPHFQSRFADLAAIFDACKEHLADAGIAIIQAPTSDGNKVTVTTRLSTEGQYYEADLEMTAAQPSPQAVGSCITYAKRYGLAAMAGVATEDDDGEAAEGRQQTDSRARRDPPKPAGQQQHRAPPTPEARKADLKARMHKAGIPGAEIATLLGEWIGREVNGSTTISADDWMKADAGIEQLQKAGATLARAQHTTSNGATA